MCPKHDMPFGYRRCGATGCTGIWGPTMVSEILQVSGGTALRGEVRVRGAKNLVPKAMVAALLGDTPSLLRDVPDISDVRSVAHPPELHGVSVTPAGPAELTLDPRSVEEANAADVDGHAGSSRIPILLC